MVAKGSHPIEEGRFFEVFDPINPRGDIIATSEYQVSRWLSSKLANGRPDPCGPDPAIVTFSCKKRGVCPSCNTKHMIFITMHLLEEVPPKLPLRQWVLSVPKWLRYHLTNDTQLASQVLSDI